MGKLVTMHVREEERARASALRSLGVGLVNLAGPLVGAAILSVAGLLPVLATDMALATLGVAILAVVHSRARRGGTASSERATKQLGAAWSFVRTQPPLVRMLSLSFAVSLAVGRSMSWQHRSSWRSLTHTFASIHAELSAV